MVSSHYNNKRRSSEILFWSRFSLIYTLSVVTFLILHMEIMHMGYIPCISDDTLQLMRKGKTILIDIISVVLIPVS